MLIMPHSHEAYDAVAFATAAFVVAATAGVFLGSAPADAAALSSTAAASCAAAAAAATIFAAAAAIVDLSMIMHLISLNFRGLKCGALISAFVRSHLHILIMPHSHEAFAVAASAAASSVVAAAA